jgi:hypothetical protein
MSEELIQDAEDILESEVLPVVSRANGIVVRDAADYSGASDFLKAIKAAQKKVADHFGPMKTAAHAAWKAITSKEAETLKPLTDAEAIVKQRMLTFSEAQERARKAEQDRLNAIEAERARKEREKAEAAARLQREKEAQAQREADEARRKAQEATNAAERERLQKEAEARQREASAAAAKAAAKEEAAASVVQNHIEVASAVPEIKGQSTRKTWKARVTDPKAAIGALLGFADWSAYIEINEGQLNKLAARTKGMVPVAGVQWYEESVMASASK